VIARAIEAAEGIPLFLEQFIKSLADERLQTPGRVSRPSGVPLMLGEMMSERLDRLPGGRRVVQAAACIGRSFTLEFLASLLDKDPPAIAEPLQALVQAEILLPRRLWSRDTLRLQSRLLQRIAYESIVQTERSATHERIVDVLRRGHETRPNARRSHRPSSYRGRQITRDAIGEWLQAGLSAARRSAHVEAIALLPKSLGLLDKISDATARRQLELGLQAALIGSIMAAEGATSIHVSECCKRGLELCREGESHTAGSCICLRPVHLHELAGAGLTMRRHWPGCF